MAMGPAVGWSDVPAVAMDIEVTFEGVRRRAAGGDCGWPRMWDPAVESAVDGGG